MFSFTFFHYICCIFQLQNLFGSFCDFYLSVKRLILLCVGFLILLNFFCVLYCRSQLFITIFICLLSRPDSTILEIVYRKITVFLWLCHVCLIFFWPKLLNNEEAKLPPNITWRLCIDFIKLSWISLLEQMYYRWAFFIHWKKITS